MLFAIITSTDAVIAQIQPPTTPDVVLMTSQRNVENTGSAMASNYPNYWHAVVWDGDSPGLAVYELPSGNVYTASLGGGFLRPYDPDVAINHGNLQYPTADKVVVSYEAVIGGASQVFYEIYDLSTSGLTLLPGFPRQLSLVSPSLNSNVDIDFLGRCVIIWEESAELAIATGDINSSTILSISPFKHVSPSGFRFKSPDVTIHGNPINFSTSMYFTYIEENPGSSVQVFSYETDYAAPFSPGVTSLWTSSAIYAPPFEIDNPRINAGWLNEYLLTYTIRDLSTNASEVFFEAPMYASTGLSNSFVTSLLPFKNARSVVDYNGDVCVVCWEFDDSQVGMYRGFNEIICHHYFHNGLVYPTSLPDYSAVSDGSNGDVSSISVCGALGLAGFAWFENSVNEIRIKHSSTVAANYREGRSDHMELTKSSEAISKWVIYPNPSHDFIQIKGLGSGNNKVLIMNALGQILDVKDNLLPNQFIDVQQLTSGIYHIEIQQLGKTEVLRFIKR